jgi:TolB-like protein/DNA-binding winged helix-turn-helix (wHTH) protein
MLYFIRGGDPVAVAVYEFGDFRLDCGRFELLRNGRAVRLERKPMDLLILLAGSNGQLVTRTEIAKRLWDSEVFVDSEHGINTAIRKIRQVLGDDPEMPDFVQTVPGMGYRFVAPVVNLNGMSEPECPKAIPSAGLTESTAGQSTQELQHPRRRLRIVLVAGLIIGALALTAAFGTVNWIDRLLNRGTKPAIASIAILPLDNLSGDPSQEYFADGMTDELTTMLAKDSTLRITSRTSVMQYKGARKPLPEIARALHVEGILEGSVEHRGAHVHMTLQLIRADTDTHLWADSYDCDYDGVAALPEQAARDVAGRLHSSVTSSPSARYVNPEAHDAYLRGRFLFFANRFEEAAPYFKKATELQEDYAPGWAGLAVCYEASTMDGRHDPRVALPQADAPAAKALALDSSLPEAHLAKSGSLFLGHWDWVHADQEILRAIDLDPDFAEAYHLRARILTANNRNAEAIEVQKKQMEIDPFARPWGMAETYYNVRQYDAAIADARLRLENFPGDSRLHFFIARSLFSKGQYKEATDAFAQLYRAVPNPQAASAIEHAYQTGGYRAVVRWQLRSLEQEAKSHYISPVNLASLHAELGQRDATLALLEEALPQRSPQLLWIQTERAFDFLHTDPRYRSLVQRIGLPPQY